MSLHHSHVAEENVPADAALQQLEAVLRSRAFANAPRLTSFLRHVVEKTPLAGDGDPLKEYSIGVEVFDRGESFDPRTDTIVRVQARRLRKKLDEYYAEEGKADPLIIELPKGGYVPRFRPTARHSGAMDAVVPITPRSRGPDGRGLLLVESAAHPETPPIRSRAVAENLASLSHETSEGQAPSVGERAEATILVSNFGGYIELVDELTPEQMDALVAEIQDHLERITERYGGTVYQFTGEGFVAVFGMGPPQEDYFVRAARAASALRAGMDEFRFPAWREDSPALSVCSGIATGSVVIQLAREQHETRRIVGSPRQTAASLALQAGPGEILVDSGTKRGLGPFFETEGKVSVRLKAGAPPVTAYRLGNQRELRNRLEGGELSVHTGREHELDRLHSCLHRAQQGKGQFVSIVGEAGLGKSRLLYEFESQLDKREMTVLEGRFLPHGSNTPFLAFIDALRYLLQGDEKTIGVRGNTEKRVASRVLEIDRELESCIPYYLNLLSIRGDDFAMPEHLKAESLRSALLEALMAVFTLSAKRKPLVLLLEDWHWSDQASRELLASLVELVETYPMAVVATSRPQYNFESNSSDHTSIRLKPLGSNESPRIMKSVLSAREIPGDMAEVLHDRSGGNPFFLEEICRGLREEGTLETTDGRAHASGSLQDIRLPATVQAVIRARLQRLDDSARRALRTAAVIGPEFTQNILQHVLGTDIDCKTPLERLRSAGLVRQVRVVPEPAYRFKHVLTHEVVYGSLLQHQRRALHKKAGEAIETLYADRIDENAERLMRHFQLAHNHSKAVRYGRLAADKYSAMGQFTEVLAILEEVESAAQRLPGGEERKRTLVEVLLQQERSWETIGDRAHQQETINNLLSVLKPGGDSEQLAETYIRQGDLHILRRRFADGETALQEALRISRAVSASGVEMRALRSLGNSYFQQNRLEEAANIIENLIARNKAAGDTRALRLDIVSASSVLRRMGKPDQAKRYVEEALALPDSASFPGLSVTLQFALGECYREMGDDIKALQRFERSMELARELNQPSFWKPWITLSAMSNTYMRLGDLEQALGCATDSLERARKSKLTEALAISLRQLGFVLVWARRDAEALPYLQEAGVRYGQIEDRESEAAMYRTAAKIFERREAHRAATDEWDKVLKLEQRRQNRPGELEALERLGSLARRQDRREEAVSRYQDAMTVAAALGDRDRLGDLHNTLGILRWEQGAYDAALTHYEQALRVCQERNDRTHEGLVLNSIGVTLAKLGRHEDACKSLNDALRLHRENGERLLKGHALAALGDIHFELGLSKQAAAYYEESLGVRRDIKDRKGEGWMLHHLARTSLAMGQHGRAQDLQRHALKIAQGDKIEELREACRGLDG